MNNEATSKELNDTLHDELVLADMLGVTFPKDFKGNDSIRDNWISDMSHFANNFVKPEGKFNTEEFLLYKIDDDHYIQGYADLIRYDKEDGSLQSILDWKTSSLYSKDQLLEHGRQLVMYALAKEQQGIEIKELAWIFLKYVTIEFTGKKRSNSKKKEPMTLISNRSKILKTLDRHIRSDMEELGYSDIEIDASINLAKITNGFDSLPLDVISKYEIKPCIVKYELTDEIRQETIDYINKTTEYYESLNKNDPEEWIHRPFYKENKNGDLTEDTFFCNFLCSHRKTCKYLMEHNSLNKQS